MNNRLTAAVYARFSSDNQRVQSIADQFRICEEYCKNHDLLITAKYADEAMTGRNDMRPEFQRMIKDGVSHKFQVLVVYALDRISRNTYDLVYYEHKLQKAGVHIVYATQPLPEGPEGTLMRQLLVGLSAYYSENLARSVKRGLQGNALKGHWAGGSVPLGILLDENKKMKIDPAGAATVRLVFEQYAAGKSKSEIAAMLNKQNRKTSYGKPFTVTSLDHMLKNQLYIGIYKYGEITVPNAVEPIIEKSLFDQVQKQFEITAKARAHRKAAVEYLLTTKLYCGTCGAWMVGESGVGRGGKIYSYYACGNKKHGTHNCTKQNEPKDVVETTIVNACRAALTDEHIIAISKAAAAKFAAETDNEMEIKRCTAHLKEVEKKISNIVTAIENGIINDTMHDRLTTLETERAAAKDALAIAQIPTPVPTAEEIAYYLASLRSGDISDPDFRRSLINHLLNSATIYDLPDGHKKIALAFNLTPGANCEIISGSDINDKVGLVTQYPKQFVIIGRCACCVTFAFWK